MVDAGSDRPPTARRAMSSIRPPEYRSVEAAQLDPISSLIEERGSSVLATVAEIVGWVIIAIPVVAAIAVLALAELDGGGQVLLLLGTTLYGVAFGLILVVLGQVLRHAKAAAVLAARAELERSV